MSRISKSSIRTKLYGLLVGYTAVVAVVLLLTGYLQYVYRIDGPVYKAIDAEKDLLESFTPPVLYISHPYLALQELEGATDPADVRQLVARYRDLEAAYQKRREEWLRVLPDGDVKAALQTTTHRPAAELFRLAEAEYLPLVGKEPAKASQVLREKIRPRFDEHRQVAFALIDKVAADTRRVETQAGADARFWFVTTSVVSGLVVLALGGAGLWLMSRIVAATNVLNTRVQEMAAGGSDLTARVPVTSGDELGHLAEGINGMIFKYQTIVSKVREASLQLLSVASEIAATARGQEGTVQDLSTSTTEVAASVREISATTRDLSGTMTEVNERSTQAAALAAKGLENLTRMAGEMKQLVESTTSVSAKLGVIREKADGIFAVVAAITRVADQTNLLSVNAAIEAEKAGEYGRGFLVVAREIRRLADQTAVATLDIGGMVRQMQDAVSAGVMQMDKFADEVRSGVSRVTSVGQMTGEIIHEVQGLSTRFQLVTDGMRNQAIGADQITEAMTTIADGARQSAKAVQEFERATTHLRGSVEGVNAEIAQFKV